MSDFLRTLYSTTGVLILIYFLVGVFINTAPPHYPHGTSLGSIHSWIQYFISVFFWPLKFWTPHFNVGKWRP